MGKQAARVGWFIDGRSAGQFNPQRSSRRDAQGLHAISGFLSGNSPRIATGTFPALSPVAAPRRGQHSTRFFALIDLDVHRRKRRYRSPLDARWRHFPPSTPRFGFWPPAGNG
jgi:hypothetical protein